MSWESQLPVIGTRHPGMASRISHQLWGHGKAQTPPQYLSACVPECPNPRVSRSPWSLQPWYHHPYCHIPGQAQPHPLAPSSLCTHIPVPPSSHSAHNPSVPTSGALIPHPLASFPLGTHILWHRFCPLQEPAPLSAAPPPALPVPRCPIPGPPAAPSPPKPPRASLTGRRRRCPLRDALRSSPAAQLCPPARLAGSCSPAAASPSAGRRENPASQRFGPKKPLPGACAAGMLPGSCRRGCRWLIQQLRSSPAPQIRSFPAVWVPLGGGSAPNLGVRGGGGCCPAPSWARGGDAWGMQDFPPVLRVRRCFTQKSINQEQLKS